MQNMPNGLPFFEVLKKKDGGFNEYVAADGFLGEYVTKLEQQSKASSESTDGKISFGRSGTNFEIKRPPINCLIWHGGKSWKRLIRNWDATDAHLAP